MIDLIDKKMIENTSGYYETMVRFLTSRYKCEMIFSEVLDIHMFFLDYSWNIYISFEGGTIWIDRRTLEIRYTEFYGKYKLKKNRPINEIKSILKENKTEILSYVQAEVKWDEYISEFSWNENREISDLAKKEKDKMNIIISIMKKSKMDNEEKMVKTLYEKDIDELKEMDKTLSAK